MIHTVIIIPFIFSSLSALSLSHYSVLAAHNWALLVLWYFVMPEFCWYEVLGSPGLLPPWHLLRDVPLWPSPVFITPAGWH